MAKWYVAAKKADFNGIGQRFSISPVLARVIRNRDIEGDEAIEKYLHGTIRDLYDPALLKGSREAVLLLNKGKRGLLRMIFGRTMVIILLLVLQVVLLAAAFLRLGEYYYGFAALAALMVSLAVVNRRRQNPAMKITWILLIMAAPVFAIPLYFFVDAELGHRVAHHRLQIILEQTAQYAPPQPELRARLAEEDPGAASLAAYVERTSHQSVYDASGVRYFPSGEEAFEAILEELEKAEQFTATNASCARRLAWWMARANTSFPVPVSPVNSTEVSVTATFRASSTASRSAAEEPITRSKEFSSESLSSKRASRRCIWAFSEARLSNGSILLLSSPLVM